VIATGQVQIEDLAMVRFGYSAFAVTSAFLVLHVRLGAGLPGSLATALRWAPLRSFGKYSYAIYVLHPVFLPAIRFGAKLFLPHGYWPMLSVPAGICISWLLGWCSWNLIEKHFNRMKGRIAVQGQLAPTAAG
jgi:peptidoglycan/LPS O-acetylase OafA/YrhL